MANADKNIVITPNRGSSSDQPKIVFTGQNNVPVTLKITDTGQSLVFNDLNSYTQTTGLTYLVSTNAKP